MKLEVKNFEHIRSNTRVTFRQSKSSVRGGGGWVDEEMDG